MSKSLRHNGISWKCSVLGEQALLLDPDVKELKFIHQLASTLEASKPKGIVDIVPAYESLAIVFDETWNHDALIQFLETLPSINQEQQEAVVHTVAVNYGNGLDWERAEHHTRRTKSEIIELHTKPLYTVAMIGFLPGFVFLEGLDPALQIPRLETPRTNIPAGSIGIGGKQTGWYSLESPGGWNIIGQTTQRFFDLDSDPPSHIKVGDNVRFVVSEGGHNG